jgi:type IV pilus assembly protein PilQ
MTRMAKFTKFFPLAAALLWGALSIISPVRADASARRDIPPGLTMKAPENIKPVLAAMNVSQGGDSTLILRLRGFDIPLPRAASAPGESKLVLHFDGARFPDSTDSRDWWKGYDWEIFKIDSSVTNSWWKQYDLPLLSRINAEPVDADSIRLTLITTKPLVIEQIDGIAGADEINVVLKAYEPEKTPPPAPKPVVYAKGDPMGITAPVTIELVDASVKAVFRMLADMQNLNLILDPSVVDQTVTFSFKGVPYNEAFAYLLRMCDLSYSVKSGMLVVSKPESLGRTMGTEFVRAYNLSYAVGESGGIDDNLTAALTGLISLSKPPVIDSRTRQIYVTATEEQHKEVAVILEKLDHPGRQIMLEARIFEVSDNGTQELEALVTAVYNHWISSFTNSGLNAGYNYLNSQLAGDNDDWSLPVGGSVGGSPVWEQFPIEGARMLSVGLRALETKGKGKNLANPSLITIDGKTATVSMTQNVKYASGVDSNGNVTFSDVQSGPKLSFLPVIGRNGIVTINVQVETGEILTWRQAGMGAQAPETSSRRVETTVRVRNGEPFVVGGLYQDNKVSSHNRIPVLGYIPLLGDLFTTRSDTHRKTEVAIIVIPYILDVPESDVETFDLPNSTLSLK